MSRQETWTKVFKFNSEFVHRDKGVCVCVSGEGDEVSG